MGRPRKFRHPLDALAAPAVAAALAELVERIECLRAEAKEISDIIASVYDEADDAGFDRSAIRQLIARRAQDPAKEEEREEKLTAYELALEAGLVAKAKASRARASKTLEKTAEGISEKPKRDKDFRLERSQEGISPSEPPHDAGAADRDECARADLSLERLRGALHYDPESGAFTWASPRRKIRVGDEAGYVDRHKYRIIHLDGVDYAAHRLAWFYVHGEWPDEIDHINGEAADNRLCNLRIATRSQNNGNTRLPSHNTSGYKGVSFYKQTNRWQAYIKKDGQRYHLGFFATAEEAAAAYDRAAVEFFGEFAKTNEAIAKASSETGEIHEAIPAAGPDTEDTRGTSPALSERDVSATQEADHVTLPSGSGRESDPVATGDLGMIADAPAGSAANKSPATDHSETPPPADSPGSASDPPGKHGPDPEAQKADAAHPAPSAEVGESPTCITGNREQVATETAGEQTATCSAAPAAPVSFEPIDTTIPDFLLVKNRPKPQPAEADA